jgi:hypothetical protein
MDHVGQTVGINADMTFDAGYQLAAIKAFVFRRVRVFDALRVNDEKAGLRVATKALSDLANHIFLKPLPRGCTLCLPAADSILQNMRSNSPILENHPATSATDIRFSAHIKSHRIPHINQALSASFSSSLFAKQVALSFQKHRG